MLEFEIFILKLGAVNARHSRTISLKNPFLNIKLCDFIDKHGNFQK